MKQIPHPEIADARRLKPMEMNNLHFVKADRHSPVPKK